MLLETVAIISRETLTQLYFEHKLSIFGDLTVKNLTQKLKCMQV